MLSYCRGPLIDKSRRVSGPYCSDLLFWPAFRFVITLTSKHFIIAERLVLLTFSVFGCCYGYRRIFGPGGIILSFFFLLSEIEDDVTFPVWGPLKCLISPSLPSIWKINTDETSALSRHKNGDGVFWDDRTEKKLNLDDLFLFGRIQPYTFATMPLFPRNL